MFVEQDASFEFFIPADQNRGASSVRQGVGRDEVFRLRSKILFLATSAPQLANLRQVRLDLAITDH